MISPQSIRVKKKTISPQSIRVKNKKRFHHRGTENTEEIFMANRETAVGHRMPATKKNNAKEN